MKGIGSIAAAAVIVRFGLGNAFAQEAGEPQEGLPTYSFPSTDIVGTTPVEGRHREGEGPVKRSDARSIRR